VRPFRRYILILFYKRRLCRAKSKSGSIRSLRTPRRSPSSLKVLSQLAEEAGIESILSANCDKIGYCCSLVN
jgi:hypothetical protein